MPKRILILGGGTGGVVAAKRLSSKLRGREDVEITLVTDNPYHEFQPLYFDLAVGNASPEEIRAPITSLERRGVHVVIDKVESIDAANRTVKGRRGVYGYDYLIVALGVRYGWEAYRGLAEAGYHNYTLEGAVELSKALARFKKGRLVVLVPELPHRCGMYPHEAATMLAESFRNRGLDVEVVLMTPEKSPMGALGADFPRTWLPLYEKLGVERVIHNGLEEVDASRRIIRARNVEEKYDLLIKVPPSRLPTPLEKSEGFQYKQDPRWAPARGRDFRHPDYDDVYLTGEHSMVPAGLVTAGIPVHYATELASDLVAADITGAYVPGMTRVMTCVGYYGASSGLAGNCEVEYDEKQDKRRLKCYLAGISPIIRLMKEAFYKAWVASLK